MARMHTTHVRGGNPDNASGEGAEESESESGELGGELHAEEELEMIAW